MLQACIDSNPIVGRLTVTEEQIFRFSEAIDDSNPLWNPSSGTDSYSTAGVVTPPTFLRSMGIAPIELPFPLPYKRGLDGGVEWEYFHHIRPGDQILATRRILDLLERQGSIGPMLLIISQITYTNQTREIIATQKNTTIRY